MASYVVKRPFTAGKPPLDVREYRVGDELTQGDVDMWAAGQFAAASKSGQIVPKPTPAAAEPETKPVLPPEAVHQT